MILRDKVELLEKTMTKTAQGYEEVNWSSKSPVDLRPCEYMTLGGKISAKEYGITDATVQSLIFTRNSTDYVENNRIKVTAASQGVVDKLFDIYLIKPWKSHYEVFLKPVG